MNNKEMYRLMREQEKDEQYNHHFIVTKEDIQHNLDNSDNITLKFIALIVIIFTFFAIIS